MLDSPVNLKFSAVLRLSICCCRHLVPDDRRFDVEAVGRSMVSCYRVVCFAFFSGVSGNIAVHMV
jgi:hypothetical protein